MMKTFILDATSVEMQKSNMFDIIIRKSPTSNWQMEKRVFIKNKSSQGEDDQRGKVYKIRARLRRKQGKSPQLEAKDRLSKVARANSCSPRKMRGTLADIFKQARKVRSCETYLISETQANLRKESPQSSPHFNNSKHPKRIKSNSHLPPNRSFSSHGLRNSLNASGKNDIFKTVSITIDGDYLQSNNKQDLMTSLSKIILGEEANPDHYTFEIFEESSILGQEQNYIDIDEIFLEQGAFRGKGNFIRI